MKRVVSTHYTFSTPPFHACHFTLVSFELAVLNGQLIPTPPLECAHQQRTQTAFITARQGFPADCQHVRTGSFPGCEGEREGRGTIWRPPHTGSHAGAPAGARNCSRNLQFFKLDGISGVLQLIFREDLLLIIPRVPDAICTTKRKSCNHHTQLISDAMQSLLAAFAKLVVRQIRGAATADLVVLSLSAVASVLATAGCLAGGGLKMPQLWQWGLLMGTGAAGYATQISITIALQVTRQAAPAVAVSYLAVLWSLAIGWLAFGELPSLASGIGASLICGSTLLLALYEYHHLVWRVSRDCHATVL